MNTTTPVSPRPTAASGRQSLARDWRAKLSARGASVCLAAALVLGAPPVCGAAERLTDLSPPREVRIDLQWARVDFRRGDADPAYHQMTASVPRVEYRLDVSRHVGRQVRVFYVLPIDPGLLAPAGLRVRWTSQGVLAAGQALSGQRVTVFAGRLAEATLADVFDLDIQVDSRLFTGRLQFNPYFEIEVL